MHTWYQTSIRAGVAVSWPWGEARPGPPARVLASILALVLLPSCRGVAGPTFAERRANDAAWEPASVLEIDGARIVSPFDPDTTRLYGGLVETQVRELRLLLEVPREPPVELALVPFDPGDLGDDPLAQLEARPADRVAGYSSSTAPDLGVVYVPFHPGDRLGLGLLGATSTVRHELAHVLLRRTMLGARPTWFEEGLARALEDLPVDAGGRVRFDAPRPADLVALADVARPGDVAHLLAWSGPGDGDTAGVVRADLYPLAHAFLRFLLVREQGSVIERARAVLALDDQQLTALEPAWLAELADFDAVDEALGLLASADDWLVGRAFTQLIVLSSDAGLRPRVRSSDAARVALARLDRPERFRAASEFLLFGPTVPDDDVLAELVSSAHAQRVLLGLALRQRRGASLDAELWARARAALDPAWEPATAAVRALLERAGR